MKQFELDSELIPLALKTLGISDMFVCLDEKQLDELVGLAAAIHVYDEGELVITAGSASDFFLVILKGEVSVTIGEHENFIEIARLGLGHVVGEIAMLRDEAHSYSYFARGRLVALAFSAQVFFDHIMSIPGINVPMPQVVGSRFQESPFYEVFLENRKEMPLPDAAAFKMLPSEFAQRNRLFPVKCTESHVAIGYCDILHRDLRSTLARMLPDHEVKTIFFAPDYFNRVMQSMLGETVGGAAKAGSGTRNVDELLRRLVAAGGSDLYLSAGQIPRWRVDGEIHEVTEAARFGGEEVLDLLGPVARPEILSAFADSYDEDFAYSMNCGNRFRVNLLRDHNGVSAVFRHIPNEIRSLEELELPAILTRFCSMPKGLVLVTGPTGCGKTTTLAAMIDWINQRRKCHILTIEDPIEFVHGSRQALVNQREVGIHTRSFAKALRAGLRENPDVVMVGEIRDNETMAMALETANTGHLVFATLHTATASSTIDRVVDNFPSDGQNQVRMFLAENLLGVVCQTLCRRLTRGCVPAFEIMIVDPAMANLIRTGKSYMLPNAMITAQANGNRLLNDDLCQLVIKGVISIEEAMNKTRDPAELERKINESGHGS